ncbi:transcription antiterminator [uncultured Dubosiella sp.]|uniref:BglG family transcription antiterminator n=1 Tax=uncultured Dubosiella sp. TaxID=1937011 RepID=UPI002604B8FF|nr:transcription antiterminator [uncultured Dubosiella sp.]
MIFSTRLARILRILLDHDEMYVSVDELASQLQTSRRTIFRELQHIDLSGYGLELLSRQGKGLQLAGSAAGKKKLADELTTQNIPYINKEERRKLLAYELLRFPEIKKLVYYGNMFSVSEATISNDLDALAPWFDEHQIHLVRTNKNNIRLEGREDDRRGAMSHIIHEMIRLRKTNGNTLDPQFVRSELFESGQSGILHLLDQDLFHEITDLFTLEGSELGLEQYAQNSYMGVIIHLCVALERIRKGDSIETDETLHEELKGTAALEQAAKIAERIKDRLDITMPPSEIDFIALHLYSAKSVETRENFDDRQLLDLTDLFIKAMPAEIASILQTDSQFINGFMTHLRPTLIRIMRGMPIYNPLLLQSVKEQYSELYTLSQQAARRMEKQICQPISESEVAFMAMHAGASLERNRSRIRKPKIRTGVICASGIGVSAMLAARLVSAFPDVISPETLSFEQYRKCTRKSIDLIISTFELPERDIPTLQVNPLLSVQDIEKIQDAIEHLNTDRPAQEDMDPIEKLRHTEKMSRDAAQIIDDLVWMKADPGSSAVQIIEEAGRNAKGDTSMIVFIWPEHDDFAQMEHVKAIFVLLLPVQHEKHEQNMLSNITMNMMEPTPLQSAVFSQDIQHIQQALASIFFDCIQNENA